MVTFWIKSVGMFDEVDGPIYFLRIREDGGNCFVCDPREDV